MTENSEEAIAAAEAIFVTYSKKRQKGEDKMLVSFLLNPLDVHDRLATLPLGEIVKLYITKPNIGA